MLKVKRLLTETLLRLLHLIGNSPSESSLYFALLGEGLLPIRYATAIHSGIFTKRFCSIIMRLITRHSPSVHLPPLCPPCLSTVLPRLSQSLIAIGSVIQAVALLQLETPATDHQRLFALLQSIPPGRLALMEDIHYLQFFLGSVLVGRSYQHSLSESTKQ